MECTVYKKPLFRFAGQYDDYVMIVSLSTRT